MLIRFINSIGDKTILFVISFYDAFVFTCKSLLHLFLPSSYNAQMRKNLITQIYHTTIRIIPYFLFLATFFGSAIIGLLIYFAAEYEMQYQLGSLIVSFVINQLATLFSVFFIIFRSQYLVKKNMSILSTNIIDNLVLPSILSGMLTTLIFSILFSVVTLFSAYVFTFLLMGMDFYTYKHLISQALNLHDLLVLVSKSLVFGFAIMIVPLYNIHKKIQKNTLLTVLLSIFFLEVLFLYLQKVLNAL